MDSPVLVLVLVSILSSVHSELHTIVEQCGTAHTSPKFLLWMANMIECVEGVPCQQNITAPPNHFVRLNFTQLSGLEFSQLDVNSSLYPLSAACNGPRIEVDETYRNRAQGDILTNTKRTLCYDWLKKRNSIILETSSNQVILSFYCLASKYSTFMMNFSFHYAPAESTCALVCDGGKCLAENQLCDGVQDCGETGDDELSCPAIEAHSDNTTVPISVIAISIALALMALVTVTLICACQRYCPTSRGLLAEAPQVSTEEWCSLSHQAHQPRRHTEAGDVLEMPRLAQQYPARVINSFDGERGYPYQVNEIAQARLARTASQERGFVPPPNVTISKDWPLDPSGASTSPYYTHIKSSNKWPPPPRYSQHDCSKETEMAKSASSSECTQQCMQRGDSTGSLASSKSAPPSYEAATGNRHVCGSCYRPT